MKSQTEFPAKGFFEMRTRWRQHILEMAGGGDIRGIEISQSIRLLAKTYDHALNRTLPPALSGPRLGILLRLFGEEEKGNHEGINPTNLSHFQQVKKNTVTSLLRGLEDQGLIERTYDPQDRRKVRIRITAEGKVLVRSTAPDRFDFLNQLASALSDDEKNILLSLLEKLQNSLMGQACEHADTDPAGIPAD
jgi:DNA-binding MarR family transcriptional regulator